MKKKCIQDYSAKIDTQFMTKTAEKPYPLGPHIPIKPILGSTPPPGQGTRESKILGGSGCFVRFSYFMYVTCCLALFETFIPCFRWF